MANGKHIYGSDGGGTASITAPSGVTTNTTLILQAKNGTVGRLEDNGGRRNYLINGNFNIAQRGAYNTITTTFSYGLDRFSARTSTGTTTFNQATINLPSAYTESLGKNHAVIASNSNGTIYFRQLIEDVSTCSGKTVTLSFNAAIYNGTAKTVRVYMYQSFGNGGTPSAQVTVGYKDIVIESSSLGGVDKKYTATFVVPSINGKTLGTNNDSSVIVEFELPSSTSGFKYDMGNFKLEDGIVATDGWHPYDGEFGGEVQACQRYYETGYVKSWGIASAAVQSMGHSQSYKVAKRVIPTVTIIESNLTNVTSIVSEPSNSSLVVFANSIASGTCAYQANYSASAEL